jgi:hypothetical protein
VDEILTGIFTAAWWYFEDGPSWSVSRVLTYGDFKIIKCAAANCQGYDSLFHYNMKVTHLLNIQLKLFVSLWVLSRLPSKVCFPAPIKEWAPILPQLRMSEVDPGPKCGQVAISLWGSWPGVHCIPEKWWPGRQVRLFSRKWPGNVEENVLITWCTQGFLITKEPGQWLLGSINWSNSI